MCQTNDTVEEAQVGNARPVSEDKEIISTVLEQDTFEKDESERLRTRGEEDEGNTDSKFEYTLIVN